MTDMQIRVVDPWDPESTYTIPPVRHAVEIAELLGWPGATVEDSLRMDDVMGRERTL